MILASRLGPRMIREFPLAMSTAAVAATTWRPSIIAVSAISTDSGRGDQNPNGQDRVYCVLAALLDI